jgi:VanZ family protein
VRFRFTIAVAESKDRLNRTLVPLKYARLWKSVGVGFVLLIVYLSLSPDPPDLGMPEGMKFGHVLAYSWLMIWFAQIYRASGQRLLLATAFCSLGIVLEFLQGMTDYRGFEYSDMLINAGGVVIGLILAYTPLQKGLRMLEAILPVR